MFAKHRIKFSLIFLGCLIAVHIKVWGQQFTAVKTGEGVEISENGKKVLFYQQQPKSLNGKYERAGYVHPLYDLNEEVLTEDFPQDHPYHRGIFLAWHQIILNNKQIADGWMSENISWEPVKLEVKKEEEFVVLQSEMLWKSILKNKPVSIARENTDITIHKSRGQYRVIDFDIHLFTLIDSLKIGGSNDIKGYGGFCLRLKLPKDISFISRDTAVIPQETAVKAGPWMDITGSFDGEASPKIGVAVFCDPSNPHTQQQWILRKEASMQNIPYPGRRPVTLPKSGLRLAYRIIIHNNLGSDAIEKLYQQYIHK